MSFSEAYVALERYADICTQQTAKEIINSSLDQTHSTVSTGEGGKINTTVTDIVKVASEAKKEREDALKAAVKDATNTKDVEIKALTDTALAEKNAKAQLQGENESLKSERERLKKENETAVRLANLEKENKALKESAAALQKKVDELGKTPQEAKPAEPVK